MSTEAMQVKDASAHYRVERKLRDVPPGYKRTDVGVIPEDWEVMPLFKLADVRSGIAKNSKKEINSPLLVHYLRVANVQDGYLDLSEMSMIRVSRDDLARYLVLPGDVLMNEGGDLDKLGRGAIWHGEFSPCVHQNHVFVVRCASPLLPDYLNVWTGAAIARRYFLVAGKQTTNLASINKTALGQLPVITPPLPEQRAIAEALSDVDGLLGALEALIAKKRAIKQAAMQQLLTSKTRLPGFSGAWETAALPQATVVRKGQLITASSLIPGSVPVIAGGKTPAYFHAEANRFQPCVTVSASGASAGYVALHKEPIFASDCSTVEESKIVTVEFAYYWLLNIQEIVYGLQSGGAQPHVQPKDLARLHIAYPALAEQQAIATVLSDMDAEIAALERRTTKTRAIKQGMMQQLLTGRVRLVEPEVGEPAC